MDIDEILHTGDRVAWKELLPELTDQQLVIAWVKASRAQVQDFAELAQDEMRRRDQ